MSLDKFKKTPSLVQKIKRRIEILIDGMHGLDFLTVIPVKELGLNESTTSKCSPSWSVLLENLFKELNITPDDRILDIGCGKGAVLRGMCKFPFNRVDGLELSDVLAKKAQSNFSRLNEGRVNIFNINAIDFMGYRDYNMYYLYNPFPAKVMERVIANINTQISKESESLIIYNNPICHSILISNGFFKVAQYPDEWGNGIFCYSNKLNNGRFQQLNLR